jgi:hypothetical protein
MAKTLKGKFVSVKTLLQAIKLLDEQSGSPKLIFMNGTIFELGNGTESKMESSPLGYGIGKLKRKHG